MMNKPFAACTLTRRSLLKRGAALSAVPVFARCASDPGGQLAVDDAALRLAAIPAMVAGIRIPDSTVARAAVELVRTVSSETLYNHCVRSYVFAALSFKTTATVFDEELVFIASMLHDLGLVDAYMTDTERFEVDGADAAVEFLRQWQLPEDKLDTVWDAIALHTSIGIVSRKRPDIAAVSLGSGMDMGGIGLDKLTQTDIDEVLQRFPRLGFKQDAVQTMLKLCTNKPFGTLMTAFAEVGRRHIPFFVVPTVEDIILLAPFAE